MVGVLASCSCSQCCLRAQSVWPLAVCIVLWPQIAHACATFRGLAIACTCGAVRRMIDCGNEALASVHIAAGVQQHGVLVFASPLKPHWAAHMLLYIWLQAWRLMQAQRMREDASFVRGLMRQHRCEYVGQRNTIHTSLALPAFLLHTSRHTCVYTTTTTTPAHMHGQMCVYVQTSVVCLQAAAAAALFAA